MNLIASVNATDLRDLTKKIPVNQGESEWKYKLRLMRILVSREKFPLIYDEPFEKNYTSIDSWLKLSFKAKFNLGNRNLPTRFLTVLLLTNTVKARLAAINYISILFRDEDIIKLIDDWKDNLFIENTTYKSLGYLIYRHREVYNNLPSLEYNSMLIIIGGIFEKLGSLFIIDDNRKINQQDGVFILNNFLARYPRNSEKTIEYITNQKIYKNVIAIDIIRTAMFNSEVDQMSVYRKIILKSFEVIVISGGSDTVKITKDLSERIKYFINVFGYSCPELFEMLNPELSEDVLTSAATAILDVCEEKIDKQRILKHIERINSLSLQEWFDFFMKK